MRKNNAVDAVLRVLPSEVAPRRDEGRVLITVDGRDVMLAPRMIGAGFPADVRRALGEMTGPLQGVPVMVAAEMSAGARELLRERRVSWADRSGRAEIRDGQGLFISRAENIRTERPTIRWGGALAATAECILDRARLTWLREQLVDRIADIGAATGYSYVQTAKTLTALDEMGYTAKSGAERGPTSVRHLVDPGRLLSDWADYYRRTRRETIRLHSSARNPQDLAAVVGRLVPGEWAVSGAAAADRIAPYLTQVSDLVAYIEPNDVRDVEARLEGEQETMRVSTGGRILIIPDRQALSQSDWNGDLRLASPIRVYADLLRLPGRGQEAADTLREVAIGF